MSIGRLNGPPRKEALRIVVRTIEPVVAIVFMIESVCLMLSATSTPPRAPHAAQPTVTHDHPRSGACGCS